jgi:hypothetical protein
MTTVDYQLGDRVKFTHTLERRRAWIHGKHPDTGHHENTWQPQNAPYGRFGGLIVGRRTLADGDVTGWEARYFTATRRFRAYLVSWHIDKRPVWVLPEHLEFASDPHDLRAKS